jgi:phage tail-like protein
MDFPTAHALLRDRRQWQGMRCGVDLADGDAGNGDLVLEPLPTPAGGKAIVLPVTLPYQRDVSGIATGPCHAVFVADTAHDRVIYLDGLCETRSVLPPNPSAWTDAPGQFNAPRGLVGASDALLVADSGNGRVQHLAWPRLEPQLAWSDAIRPTALALDSKQRVLLIDAVTTASGVLHRVRANGAADLAFDAAVLASGQLVQPLFVAVGAHDRVMVSDGQNNSVALFDVNGAFLASFPGPAGWLPGALACTGARVYVADAADASIHVFTIDDASGAVTLLGTLSGWQGPVTALAAGADGSLFIKPDLTDVFYQFVASGAFVPQGTLVAGPFDAGENRTWERAWADAAQPAGTTVALEVALAAASTPAPGPADWLAVPCADALLALFAPPARFAWLRLTLSSRDGRATPRVQQTRLATAAEDYFDYLPLTYRYNDSAPDGFLSCWLRLMRGECGRVEEALDDMPRVADPRFSQPDILPWLAQWFGLELPQIADDQERRELIANAVRLFARRGSKASIARFVGLHTGITPVITEAFADRAIWVLGERSRLDFDTRLPALDPLGMVVPDPTVQTGCCPASAAPASTTPCSPCPAALPDASDLTAPVVAMGRAVVGASGPLAPYQIGLPLYAEEAYRFCVLIDSYRAGDPQTLQEVKRIVDREKPAHTDYRINLIAPDLRVGFQARIGVDAVVGGDPPPLRLGSAALNLSTDLPPSDVARVGAAALDGSLQLT